MFVNAKDRGMNLKMSLNLVDLPKLVKSRNNAIGVLQGFTS